MNKEEIRQFLRSSLDDKRLSRNEFSVFKDILGQIKSNERHWLRQEIFRLASEKFKDPRDKEILEWIEMLMKPMIASQEERQEEAYFFPSRDSFEALIHWLKKARRQLDVCVFTITNNELARTLLDLHRRKVAVRIITDDEKSLDLGSDIEELMKAGIPVRFDDSEFHMHHKFAIIDRKILINGSFNWTRSAVLSNQENIQITNSPRLIELFSGEFEKLWKSFAR